jgi:hypothetical protein
LERSKSLVLLQIGGFDVPLATALRKTFLLRMLNDSSAGRNPTRVVVPIEVEEEEEEEEEEEDEEEEDEEEEDEEEEEEEEESCWLFIRRLSQCTVT